MVIDFGRRQFILALGGVVAAWPLAVHAQQQAVPVIGFLNALSRSFAANQLAGFLQGLKESGFVEGGNVAIEYRWADGHYDRLPALAADLVGRQVSVIMAGSPPAARATKTATATIPIVFTSGDDPVNIGLVASLSRPGGNVTGVHLFLTELSAKKLGLLHDLLPQATVVAVLLNSTSPSADVQTEDLQAAGHALGLQIQILKASSEQEIDAAFAVLEGQKVGALIVGSDPYYLSRREQIIALTARQAIPAVYEIREYVDAGGLMSYGTSIRDGYRLAGGYVGRILKGEKPADLPVLQPTKFEFAVNLKTAKALGLTIPPGVLAIADAVIE
jgi:putative ABC transport system substrate-binding protein